MLQNEFNNIYITGHKGFAGRAILNQFKLTNHNCLTADKNIVNLLKSEDVENFIASQNIDCIIHCAARVGGIQFNINNPATMGYENSLINLNILQAAHKFKIKKVIFLGSSCCYPRNCPQPMLEEYLLTGAFEPTNELYGISKTLGVKMVEAYNKQYGYNWFSVQPCNLYGPNDNFDPLNSHFIAANIKKFHEAKKQNLDKVICWGSGNARREIMYVEDLANAIHFLLYNNKNLSLINIGMGIDKSIKELVEIIKKITNYNGIIEWDLNKPDGMPQKLLNVDKLNNLGWKYNTNIEEGIQKTYDWWKEQIND